MKLLISASIYSENRPVFLRFIVVEHSIQRQALDKFTILTRHTHKGYSHLYISIGCIKSLSEVVLSCSQLL